MTAVAVRARKRSTSWVPVELALAIEVDDRSAAMREEARIKRLPRAAKLDLIESPRAGRPVTQA